MKAAIAPMTTEAPAFKAAPIESGSIKFNTCDHFRKALRARVDEYFKRSGREPRDCPQMYVKTAIIFSGLIATYLLLVFAPLNWWLGIPLCIVLGLAMAGVGFNVQHDGAHRAYSKYGWINRLTAMTLDLLGGSSYIWARKHNKIHHSYTNIAGHDEDINVGFFARIAPEQRWRYFHRLQQYYLWFLYGFLPIKWQWVDDFKDVLVGRIGEHPLQRPKGWDLVQFVGGKVAFFSFVFVLPVFFHSFWVVLGAYVLASFAQGLVLSTVFQLAHCVEEAEFPTPQPETGQIESSWAAHQVETTVGFAPRNKLLSWFVGGLNFQLEHHLFPQICHIHYAAIAPLVEQTCKEFGLRYRVNRTFLAGVASHFRWLRQMGRPVPAYARN